MFICVHFLSWLLMRIATAAHAAAAGWSGYNFN